MNLVCDCHKISTAWMKILREFERILDNYKASNEERRKLFWRWFLVLYNEDLMAYISKHDSVIETIRTESETLIHRLPLTPGKIQVPLKSHRYDRHFRELRESPEEFNEYFQK
jgi:hypothetical protein